MNVPNSPSRRKKCLKFLGWSMVGFAGLLAVWIVGGNYIASQQEKEIDRDLAEFARRFPKTEPNDSALKLAALVAKLGINAGGGTRQSPFDRYISSSDEFTSSEGDRKAFDNIQEELGNYLGAQLTQPNDTIDPPSEKLQRYLASKQVVLAEIRQHILKNEAPRWETDIDSVLEGDMTAALPSHLWRASLQKVLTLDILENYRKGQTEAAVQMIEVSWKLNQSLTEQPSFIAQLVALIISRYQAGVMRKVDNLPAEWQQRLQERDYRESLSASLQGEALYNFNFWHHFIWKRKAWSALEESFSSTADSLGISRLGVFNLMELFSVIDFTGDGDGLSVKDKIAGLTLSNAIFWLKPVMKPYVRFSAIDTYRAKQRLFAASHQQNICVSDSVEIENVAGWNYMGWPGWEFNPSMGSNQFSKAAISMLDLELTQKILQVKALAAKEGKWLPSVPDMESSICPGAKWRYRLAPDGTMSISFSEKPQWLEKRLEYGLPFTYSDKTPPQPKKQASTPQKR